MDLRTFEDPLGILTMHQVIPKDFKPLVTDTPLAAPLLKKLFAFSFFRKGAARGVSVTSVNPV